MRRFLIALALYAVLLSALGSVLYPADAAAVKTVMAKCARATPKIGYPHWKHTAVPCRNPGYWVRITSKRAVQIGTWPILFGASA